MSERRVIVESVKNKKKTMLRCPTFVLYAQ